MFLPLSSASAPELLPLVAPAPSPGCGRLTERLMEELDRQLLHLVRVAQPEDFKGFLRPGQAKSGSTLWFRMAGNGKSPN